jgi:hypothetical protein
MTKHLLSLAALAGMFPSFFAERRRRKSQAKAAMERKAHNAAIDAQKAAKRQAKAMRRDGRTA